MRKRVKKPSEYERAMRRALGRKPFLKGDARYLSREELHERKSPSAGRRDEA